MTTSEGLKRRKGGPKLSHDYNAGGLISSVELPADTRTSNVKRQKTQIQPTPENTNTICTDSLSDNRTEENVVPTGTLPSSLQRQDSWKDMVLKPLRKFLSVLSSDSNVEHVLVDVTNEEELENINDSSEQIEDEHDGTTNINGSSDQITNIKIAEEKENQRPVSENSLAAATCIQAEDQYSTNVEPELDLEPYYFMSQLPPREEALKQLTEEHLHIRLPVNCKKPTLVLDLDETLCHSTTERIDNWDLTFEVKFHGSSYVVYVLKRPHLSEFLKTMSELFELVVFTASHRSYADPLLNLLDPTGLIKHRLFRESCLSVDGVFLKDLSMIGRDLKNTVIIDNSPYVFAYQIDNGIPISSWFQDKCDRELLNMIPFLKRLAHEQCDDVRTEIRERFRVRDKIEQARRSTAMLESKTH
uniref:FCP1 homology domain-containing protein n=1 Tax=Aplanochytrium stocchinoi TaxID=215587 RepID=A0A6S8FV16_9STRA|mmetsp:Transcript_426/g.500  ORF Transcript_426/g.500 Transcript_426/m.500 type:complete len:416 (-) Transcript_426:1114-2361(-)|eukprot:CAMPEP_0204833940 /NCGR_PEP_ID=MMETSP1346-20131115/18277_1 /ASSEMBLY_ACC=CAM_ASM_000771 /TAXON_ID=215587 /ORGANISM="Aplanochytrium stocchinoi, Strain GSBS06" /LENGTH=415 /DNA_ID=CAMNT_0051966867 /DNA_START=209 /DNA_END=1456 /DNA_ORIENTATION=-